jgi:hypothetical protein
MSAVDVAPGTWLQRRTGTRPRIDDPFHPGYWERRGPSPELRKALSVVQRYVAEARNLLALPDDQAPLRTADVRQHLRELLTRNVRRMKIDSAWEIANQLRRDLLLLGDVQYVWTQLEVEAARDGRADKWHGWSDHFPKKKLDALVKARRPDGTVALPEHREAVRCLQKLYELRAEAGLDRRTRAAQKCRYLTVLIPILLALLVALSLAIHEVGGPGIWKAVLLAASAGALGATITGTLRIRDRLIELDDLRSFGPAMRIQPLIGASAGLVMLLVLESHAAEVGSLDAQSWSARALLTFAAGFSEPFFLGVVQRVAVVPDKNGAPKTA